MTSMDPTHVIRLHQPEVGAHDVAFSWDGKQVRDSLHKIAEALRRHPIAEFVDCTMDV